MATDSDATDKGLVAYRLGFWAERRTALQRVDASRVSVIIKCDFVISSPSGRAFRLDRAHHPFTSGAASRVIDDDDGRR